jgi:hypothetical protein
MNNTPIMHTTDDTRNLVPPPSFHILSFNACKSWDNTSLTLERCAPYTDIILFQEPGWRRVRSQPSSTSREGDNAYGPPIHSSWLPIIPAFDNTNPDGFKPRTVTYVNKRLTNLKPQLRLDLIKHRDLSLITLKHPDRSTTHILNVYNDGRTHSALNFLIDNANNLPNIDICAGDFNIQDAEWDEGAKRHYGPNSHANLLVDVMCSLGMIRSTPNNPNAPTRVPPQSNNTRPSIIDLCFATPTIIESELFDHHTLNDDASRLDSDHNPISIRIANKGQNNTEGCMGLAQNSIEEDEFVEDVTRSIENMVDKEHLPVTKEELEIFIQGMASIFESSWLRHASASKPSRHSKKWWDKDCKKAYRDLKCYRLPGQKRDPLRYSQLRRLAKQKRNAYFNKAIKTTAVDKKRPWDLLDWTRKRNLPACEAILDNKGKPCNDNNSLFHTIHETFNSANERKVNFDRVTECLPPSPPIEWPPFSALEFTDALKSCSKNSALGPDHITWHLIKRFSKTSPSFAATIVAISNACINLSTWPSHFKNSTSIIIPKPNKPSYDKIKSFRPIVLLNTTGKLIEKMIATRLQHYGIINNLIHPCQTGGILQ